MITRIPNAIAIGVKSFSRKSHPGKVYKIDADNCSGVGSIDAIYAVYEVGDKNAGYAIIGRDCLFKDIIIK